jgi:hypothetical protein
LLTARVNLFREMGGLLCVCRDVCLVRCQAGMRWAIGTQI